MWMFLAIFSALYSEDRRFGHMEGPNGESVWIAGEGRWVTHHRFIRCKKCGGGYWFGRAREVESFRLTNFR